MKQHITFISLIAVIGVIQSVAGCMAKFDRDLMANNMVTLELQPSPVADFEEIRVLQTGATATISGVIKYAAGRTTRPIPGHIHIEFVGPSDELILQANLPYRQNIPGSTAYGRFEISFHATPPKGSHVRISHSPLPISDHREPTDPSDHEA